MLAAIKHQNLDMPSLVLSYAITFNRGKAIKIFSVSANAVISYNIPNIQNGIATDVESGKLNCECYSILKLGMSDLFL